MARGRLLGRSDGRDGRIGQEVELADGPDTQAQAMGARVLREPNELGFEGREDARDLCRWPPKIVGREHPEADRPDPDFRAPLQHLVELLGPQRVGFAKVGHPALEGVATVAVEDDAEVAGNLPPADLPQEAPPVEIVEEAAHRQSFNASPLGPSESRKPRSSPASTAGRGRRCAAPGRGLPGTRSGPPRWSGPCTPEVLSATVDRRRPARLSARGCERP